MPLNITTSQRLIITGCAILGLLCAHPRTAAAETKCTLNYRLNSWSVFYKSGKGSGTIKCDNGQHARVHLRSVGGGITFGNSKIVDGHGVFSTTSSISNLYGAYANAAAHGGAGDAGAAQALTKGDISLALTGTGKGINVGIDFGSFKITKM